MPTSPTRSPGSAASASRPSVNVGRSASATDQLPDAIADGAYYGMQTFDQHLLELYRTCVVSLEAALDAATNPHDFRISVRGLGVPP
jgi:twitching motility protein PilT